MEHRGRVFLSVVIPAYNEEQRLGGTLERLFEYLQAQPYDSEVIVVDDGSRDRTAQIAAEVDAGGIPLEILQNTPNRGKGYSVRRGFLAARGERVLFSDADLSTPIEEVEKLLSLMEEADVAIASRALADSDVTVHQPWYREGMGRMFNVIVQTFALRGIRDTQCGFKCFTREAARAVCQLLTCDRFAFDVEMLYLARKQGFIIREAPVTWINSEKSTVCPVSDSASMILDVLRIRWNDLRGRYTAVDEPRVGRPEVEAKARGC